MKPSDKVAAKLLKDMANGLGMAYMGVLSLESHKKLLARYERWKKSLTKGAK